MLLTIQTQKELAQQQFHFLTSLLRLRQICCHPRLVNDDCQAPSAKVEALLEQLEPLMEEGQKVLVFSQFVELLDSAAPGARSNTNGRSSTWRGTPRTGANWSRNFRRPKARLFS